MRFIGIVNMDGACSFAALFLKLNDHFIGALALRIICLHENAYAELTAFFKRMYINNLENISKIVKRMEGWF